MNFQERYILMNKDKPIAGLGIVEDKLNISTIYNDLPTYIYNLENWLNYRISIHSRVKLLKLAKLANINNVCDFLTISKALSINDTFWVNDLEQPITWSEINPYINKLNDAMANIAINGGEINNNDRFDIPSPQYTLDGSVDKCIRQVNNELYIYKTDGEQWSDLAGARPYSDYLVSLLATRLHLNNYIKYNLLVTKTKDNLYKPYTYCKIFTSDKIGLVQMEHSSLRPLSFNDMIEYWEDKGDTTSILTFNEMLLLDSITLNFDRHLGNWGILINNDTQQELGMAPIYDNDYGLGSKVSMQNKTMEEVYDEVMHKKSSLGFGEYDEMAYTALQIPIIRQHFLEMLNTKVNNKIILCNRPESISERRFTYIHYIINRRIYEINKLIVNGN